MGKELPNNWIAVSLEDSCDILDSQRIPVSANERAKRTGNIPYYGATGQAGTIDDYIFDEELVLIGEDGAPFFDKKKNVAYLIQGKSWVNNHAHVLRGKNKILENKLLLHYLNHFNYEDYVGGTTRLKLTQQNLKKIPISLPPLLEQNRIVEKLDTIFYHLEQLKTKLDKIPGLLKNFRQAVLNQAVTGKLTEEWREGRELNSKNELDSLDIKILNKRKELPDSWSVATIGEYLLNFDTQRIPISLKLRAKRKGKYPYYGATGIIDYIDDYTHEGDFILISEDGKNIIYRSKPLAFRAKGKIWVNNHAHVLQSKGKFKNAFAIYFFNTKDLSDYITGIDQVKLSQKNLNQIEIPVPSTKEQQEIVNQVESLFSKADKIEKKYQTLKEKIDQLPQAILAKVFKGELVEQLPTDGDAKVLLEQIQKAKAELEKPGKTKPKPGKTREIPDNEERMAAEPKGRYGK